MEIYFNFKLFVLFFTQFLLNLTIISTEEIVIDENGYIVFCPCMGRFGNQVDQMLGSFNFAKVINRTLIVPPFINFGHGNQDLVPFKNVFQVSQLSNFHRVITIDKFMSKIAASIWPVSKRYIFCYQERTTVYKSTGDGGCNAKDGNPFKYFWDYFNIDFVVSYFYSPLNFFADNKINIQSWNDAYPASQYPVLAFVGAPSNFPVTRSERFLQKYFIWSKKITSQTDDFLKDLDKPILGLHLRQDSDWDQVCVNIKQLGKRHLFASAQCLGDNFEFSSQLTHSMCRPDWEEILTRITRYIISKGVKTIFVATDKDIITHLFKKHLNGTVNIAKYTPSNLFLDLSVLSRTDYYIGNCVSTFSAVATYDRLIHDLPVDFWGFYSNNKDEL